LYLWQIAWDVWASNGWDIYNLDQKIKINDADLDWTKNALQNYNNAFDKANTDYLEAKAETEKFQRLSIIYEGENAVLSSYYDNIYKKYNLKTYKLILYKEILEKNIIRHRNNLKKFENKKITFDLDQEQNKHLEPILLKRKNDAARVYEECRKGCLFPIHINLSLNLKSSCKEIKQKIKTLNQKTTSSNNKILDLKYGLNNLHILNINKKLYNEKIKITTDLLEKLDNLRPYIPETLTLFFTFYNEAKANSASYQMESNTLANKIKISKEKAKTISDKKKRLKLKISSLLKQFKKCLKG